MRVVDLATINIEENLLGNLIATFPGGLLPSDGEVVGGALDLAGQYINQILYMRGEAAISGAMRWPRSQEARIDLTGGLRFA